MRSARCARPPISAAITRARRAARLRRSNCPGRPASATRCTSRGAACGRRSRRGISRWRSSSARPSAALVAGNTVVAKPAPQTPRDRALRGRAGASMPACPKDALVLVPGGPEVGAALTADVRVAGVAFTGSTATAKRIARTLVRGRRPPDRAADRRDRRDQRDDRRFDRAARTGGGGCRHLVVPLGGAALLGAAAAAAAGG